MELEKIANVNEVQLIGKVMKLPEKLKAANGKPFLRVIIETERFMIMANDRRERIAQIHTVVIRKESSIAAFEAHARPGVTVRIVGEINYDPKPEITVWEHLGRATLMSMPLAPVSTPAATQQSAARQASAATTTPQRPAPQSTGGPARISVAANRGRDVGPDIDIDDGDDDGEGNAANAVFDAPVFQHSNSLDEIPF